MKILEWFTPSGPGWQASILFGKSAFCAQKDLSKHYSLRATVAGSSATGKTWSGDAWSTSVLGLAYRYIGSSKDATTVSPKRVVRVHPVATWQERYSRTATGLNC